MVVGQANPTQTGSLLVLRIVGGKLVPTPNVSPVPESVSPVDHDADVPHQAFYINAHCKV